MADLRFGTFFVRFDEGTIAADSNVVAVKKKEYVMAVM